MASLEHAKTARDCLRFLRKKRLFIPTDVIFIQYLLKNIDCGDLFDKCYRYAEAQKALCFYEKPPGNYMINCYQKLASNCLVSSFFFVCACGLINDVIVITARNKTLRFYFEKNLSCLALE